MAPVTTEGQISQTAGLAKVIWHECFERLFPATQVELMVTKFQSADAIRQQIQDGAQYFLTYFTGAKDDEPGGYIAVQPQNGKLLLSKMYFLADHRGKGYGKEVLAFVEELARQQHCDGVWLTVNRQNERAIAVYRHTGFTQVGQEQVDKGGGFMAEEYVFEKPV